MLGFKINIVYMLFRRIWSPAVPQVTIDVGVWHLTHCCYWFWFVAWTMFCLGLRYCIKVKLETQLCILKSVQYKTLLMYNKYIYLSQILEEKADFCSTVNAEPLLSNYIFVFPTKHMGVLWFSGHHASITTCRHLLVNTLHVTVLVWLL